LARVWAAGGQAWEVVGDRQVLRDDPGDPMRTFVRQVMGAAGQLEAALIRARLQDGRRRKAERDGYVGGWTPYGYERKGKGRTATLVEVEEEQAILARITKLRRRGRSYRQIASHLNRQGILAKGGGTWGHTSVRAILLRRAVLNGCTPQRASADTRR
jgi:DNA invertase Pin-like site-specific DNA recombinase